MTDKPEVLTPEREDEIVGMYETLQWGRDKDAAEAMQDLHQEIKRLRGAIRQHRDEKGHDRCWLDDTLLYRVLPEGMADADLVLPPKDEFLRGCERYWKLRSVHGPAADDMARKLAAAGTLGKPGPDVQIANVRVISYGDQVKVKLVGRDEWFYWSGHPAPFHGDTVYYIVHQFGLHAARTPEELNRPPFVGG